MGGTAPDAPDATLGALPPGALVVTANRRLAAHLTARHDAARLAAGERAWPAPDILSLNAWVARSAEAAWPERGGLSDAHALLLWERVVANSEAGDKLLRPAAAARQAWAAWQLARAWRVPLNPENVSRETRVFQKWAGAYQTACRAGGWDDPADRLDALAGWLRAGTIAAPPVAWFAGFDRIAPDLRGVMAALGEKGCDVRDWPTPDAAGTARRMAADDPAHEARLAARWARARVERGLLVGIVVPELAAYRPYLERALTEQLTPGRVPGAGAPGAVNFSLGLPLSAEPVVAGALALLAVDRRPLPAGTLGMVLRGPWLGAAEGSARALAAARLLSRRRADTPLAGLLPALADNPALPETARRLRRWLAALAEQGGKRSPSAWARTFWELLAAIGWPGDVAPDSRAFQAVARFGELLRDLAALDPVAESMDRAEAVARLSALAGAAIFQPQGGAATVQVLGVLEAAGIPFDALWLMGFRDDQWPLSAAPNPFLPVAAQRALEMPRSGPAAELAFAKAASLRLLGAAPEVVVSHPRQSEAGEGGPSPLFAHLVEIGEDALHLAPDLRHGRRMAASAALAEVADPAGPPLAPGELGSGGTALFADQAACPFKAFATHRLGARLEEEAEPGLDALERGNLVHAALEGLWRRLQTSAALAAALESGELPALLDEAAAQAVDAIRAGTGLTDAFARLERYRVAALLGEWLNVESGRAPFSVVATELRAEATAGGVTVRARIDRIDRLADGGEVLIDYKTGTAKPGDWFGERPDAPQLPLYAITRDRPPAGVAFGTVKRGGCGFIGLTEADGVLPDVKPLAVKPPDGAPPEWAQLVPQWRGTLDRLGAAFAAGDAAVDPKRHPATCRHCALHPLCRVWETHDLGDDGEGGDD